MSRSGGGEGNQATAVEAAIFQKLRAPYKFTQHIIFFLQSISSLPLHKQLAEIPVGIVG